MSKLKDAAKKLNLDKAYHTANKMIYGIKAPFAHESIDINCDEARRILDEFSKKPAGSSFADNELIEPFKYDLQIIIPAYNVEKYLKECMDSVLSQQTECSFTVTLIDDGSTDGTPQIADSYGGDSRVNIIHQENRGFSGARNRGLEKIEAKYISFVDSDDVLPQGALQALMSAALKKDADIVEGGFYNLTGNSILKKQSTDSVRAVNPQTSLRGQPWGKVYRSSLFKCLHFPEGFWFEDSINSFLIFPSVKSAYVIPDCVYTYRIQPDSITRTAPSRPKCIDTYWITEMLVTERKKLGLPENEDFYNKFLSQLMLNAQRVSKMPEDIKKCVFVLTADLVEKNFEINNVDKKYVPLLGALKKRDYGEYSLYCSTHTR